MKPATGGNRLLVMTQWRMAFGSACLAIAVYFGYLGYLETRVNTPFEGDKLVVYDKYDNNRLSLMWGSYRPAAYFGMKARDPHSPDIGLMWYNEDTLRSEEGIRHYCSTGDEIKKYGWNLHDGRYFGVQKTEDPPFLVETSFVKTVENDLGGDWTARIKVDIANQSNSSARRKMGLFWYTTLDEKSDGKLGAILDSLNRPDGIYGEAPTIGEFEMRFFTNDTIVHRSYLTTAVENFEDLRRTLARGYLRYVPLGQNRQILSLSGEALFNDQGRRFKDNVVVIQYVMEAPFTLEIAYKSMSTKSNIDSPLLIGDLYKKRLLDYRKDFNEKFEKIFGLNSKGFSKADINFAKAALSNMLGGIGYFYGSSRVQSVYTKEPVPYWKAPLYTAVPSRSFFPRGFLWDEGFHGLLISEWDLDIELDIISHWFDLINVEGWIPREQILGAEALSKVPEEFVTQKNTYANPPTFFLTLHKIITKFKTELSHFNRKAKLDKLYPRLQLWFAWYNTTQKGELFGTYRWRGRDETSTTELNPKTLASGLDDYPRPAFPTNQERHIDLRCWIAFAAGVMADLSKLLGRDDLKYWETFSYLSDNTLLNELHLSSYTETYSDWGLHTDSVVLRKVEEPVRMDQPLHYTTKRVALKAPEWRYVDSSFGYVSLFPLLLQILEPTSFQLGKTLTFMRDPSLIWSDYGLRSLAKSSPLYMKRNTEHDPPYWRGQIWININYLALRALHYYGSQEGPFMEESKRIYRELRSNLITNIIKQYNKTGYIWEQYNDSTGAGSGCRPFTGWSALVVLMMSEKY